ncbi:alpha/beta hydrolase family protein [Paenibacillus sp. NPDC056579]|uniref:alpha/beta hydrolase family protein n=1 Tax=Paenibacillus sp. NPDC056579 TaxID=3345871 RepID=UPI00367D00AB
MWNPDAFLEQLVFSEPPKYSFSAVDQEQWSEWRASLKEVLVQKLALPDRSRASLSPVLLEKTDCGDYVRELIQLETAPHLTMPCYVLKPKKLKAPAAAVIACPGHGYGSKELVGLLPDGSTRSGEPGIYKDYPIELVRRGCIVVVPEMLGLGSRRTANDAGKEAKETSCFRLATNLLMIGRTLAGYRVHEMMCCVDYLQERPEAAADRIGCMGFSGGGLVMGLTAAVDERIRAAVISGYTNTYRDSLLAKPHCSDNYIPELLSYADMPDLFGLIAPRPLFIETGLEDAGFPVAGAMKAIKRLRTVYGVLGCDSRLEQDIHPGKHEVSGRASFDWLVRQLMA